MNVSCEFRELRSLSLSELCSYLVNEQTREDNFDTFLMLEDRDRSTRQLQS
jgi:hypothetical protein